MYGSISIGHRSISEEDAPVAGQEAVAEMLDAPTEAARLGRNAHAAIARSHLVTHHFKAFLKLLQRVQHASTPRKGR